MPPKKSNMEIPTPNVQPLPEYKDHDIEEHPLQSPVFVPDPDVRPLDTDVRENPPFDPMTGKE